MDVADRKLNFGIVGYGNIGKRHANLLLQNKNATLVSICDIDPLKLSSVNSEISQLQNFEDLLQTNIDIVNICTPHYLHKDMAILAMSKGKHVLVEKPMCLSSADAIKMANAAKKYKKRLFVVKQNRYNEPVKIVSELLDKNKLGTIYQVICNVFWNRNNAYYENSNWHGKIKYEGGALYTQASHFIDLLVHWFGAVTDVKTITSTAAHHIEIEDEGSSIFKFNNNILGNINWSNNLYNNNYEGSITIIGELGTVKIGGSYLNKIDYWNVKNIAEPNFEKTDKPNVYNTLYQGSSNNHDCVFNDVIDVLLFNKNRNMVEGAEAIQTIKAIETIYGKQKKLK